MASSEQDTAAKSAPRKPGKANIYVYRNESMGAAIKMPVAVNGKLVGDTAAKTYLLLEVAPGQHIIMFEDRKHSTVTVNAVRRSNYFLWQEVKMGLMVARSNLQASGRETVGRVSKVQARRGR